MQGRISYQPANISTKTRVFAGRYETRLSTGGYKTRPY